jgi:uncharacterized membrane protein YhiD involved in acid resistance
VNPFYQDLLIFRLSPADALVNFITALICSIFIAIIYSQTYKGVNFSSTYSISIIMLALITAMVIMVIGNNLARAFGLVGAMSIIRFRTAVKDTQDIIFIFFALAIGLASGAGQHLITIIGTVFIGIVVLVSTWITSGVKVKKEYLVQLVLNNETIDEAAINQVLKKHCTASKLINIKRIAENELFMTEYSYYITFRRNPKPAELIQQLHQVKGVSKVNLFFDEKF